MFESEFMFFLFATITRISSMNSQIVHAETKYGTVEGTVVTIRGRQYHAFMGIPYAKPPVGKLRFRKPERWLPWQGVLQTKSFSRKCIQFQFLNDTVNPSETGTSEDCLYLNVFTPGQTTGSFPSGYPVMFWIHGGGWYFGSASDFRMEGIFQLLVSRQVIVVTINYRLWVLGLFQQVISQSGTVLMPMGTRNKSYAASFARQLANAANCRQADAQQMIDCLRTKSVYELRIASKKAGGSMTDNLSGPKFGPIMDDGSFFPGTVKQLIRAAPRKRTIIGINELEGIAMWNVPMLGGEAKDLVNDPNFGVDYLMKQMDKGIKVLDHLNLTNDSKKILKSLINATYFKDSQNNKTALLYSYIELLSDLVFAKSAYEDAKQKLAFGHPVWLYMFSYVPPAFPPDAIIKGAMHFMEVPFLFGTNMRDPTTGRPMSQGPFSQKDLPALMQVTNHMTSMWTNFAKFGNPTPEKIQGVEWIPLKTGVTQYLDINIRLEMKDRFKGKMVEVFEILLPNIRKCFGSEGL